jgi:alpha-1,2-mannosyltransferase
MHKGRVAALFSGLLVLYCLTLTRVNVVNDVDSVNLASWRIANTGAPWLDGVPYHALAAQDTVWVAVAANGHLVSFRSPGPIVAGVPGYFAARLQGVESYSVVPGGIVAALLTVCALLLLFLALRDRLGTTVSGVVVAVLGLTTPVWSVSADGLWTHPVTILGIAGMTWACVRERWWLVGLFGGVAVWGRLHTAVIVAVLGLGLAWSRRQPRIALVAGSISAACLALSAVWSHWLYGSWGFAGGYSLSAYSERAVGTSGRSLVDQVVNHLGLWVAPDRGILVWSPVLLVLLPAVVRSWRSLPDWSRWLLGGGVVYTLVQGQLNGFSGGSGFFGYRLTLELLMCAAPAFVLSLGAMGSWARAWLGPVLGLQFGAFALGAVGQGGILNENHLWTQNAYVYALTHAPVLLVWLALTVFLGWATARVVRDRMSSEGPAQAPVS